jgi:hypothetical protein
MKLLIGLIILLTTTAAFADSCTTAGESRAEQWVRDEVQMRYGNNIKVEAITEASISNVYTTAMTCTYSTLFTFNAYDSNSGLVKRFIGHSVVDNRGARPVAPILQVAKDL